MGVVSYTKLYCRQKDGGEEIKVQQRPFLGCWLNYPRFRVRGRWNVVREGRIEGWLACWREGGGQEVIAMVVVVKVVGKKINEMVPCASARGLRSHAKGDELHLFTDGDWRGRFGDGWSWGCEISGDEMFNFCYICGGWYNGGMIINWVQKNLSLLKEIM